MHHFAPMRIELDAIGVIEGPFREKFGLPRGAGIVPDLPGKVLLKPPYNTKDALSDLIGFGHIWLLTYFPHSRNEDKLKVRPPRLGGNKRLGLFATRSPFRPNPLGLSLVKLVSLEEDQEGGISLIISGHDLLHGTPVLDIKPYLYDVDYRANSSQGWCSELQSPSFSIHWNCSRPHDKLAKLIEDLLLQRPIPAYKNDPSQIYGMTFDGINIRFRLTDNEIFVESITDLAENSHID